MKGLLAALFAIAACGDSSSAPVDAWTGPDASGPRAVITVRDRNSTPLERVRIAVQAPGGNVEIFHTDAAGEAAVRLIPDSRVWVVRAGDPFHNTEVTVVESISPGQRIDIGGRAPVGTGTAGVLTLTFEPMENDQLSYWFPGIDQCSSDSLSTTPGSIEVDVNGCARGPREGVIVALESFTSAVGYLHVPDLVPAAGTRSVDGTFEAGVHYDISITGVSLARFIGISVYSPASWYVASGGGWLDSSGGRAILTGPTMPSYNLLVSLDSPDSSGRQSIGRPLAGPPTTFELDASALLPYPTDLAFDPVDRRITWRVDPGPVEPQLAVVTFSGRSATGVFTDWTLYAPGDRVATARLDPPVQLELGPEATNLELATVKLVHVDAASYADLITDVDTSDLAATFLEFRPTTRRWISSASAVLAN